METIALDLRQFNIIHKSLLEACEAQARDMLHSIGEATQGELTWRTNADENRYRLQHRNMTIEGMLYSSGVYCEIKFRKKKNYYYFTAQYARFTPDALIDRDEYIEEHTET